MLGLGHTAADGIMDDLEKHLVRREEPGGRSVPGGRPAPDSNRSS